MNYKKIYAESSFFSDVLHMTLNDTAKDLNLFKDILPKIDYTITKYGYDSLCKSLKHIETGVKLIDKIVAVKYLFEKKDYRRELEIKLFEINKLDEDIYYWFDQWTCTNDLYFTKDLSLLNNEYLLNITNKVKISTVLIQIIFYFVMFKFYKYMGIDMTVKDYILGLIDGYKHGAAFVLSFALSSENAIELIARGLSYLYVAYQLYQIYLTILESVNHYYVCEAFKEKYNNIIKMIDIVDDIWKSDTIRGIIDININVDKHITNLRTHFHDNMHLGSMLMEKMNCDQYKNDFNAITNYIGMLDELTSNSILLENGYTSPFIIESKVPMINATGLWHPMLHSQTQVRNNIFIGNHDSTKSTMPTMAIITGPNKAGKSTYMKSTILATYLAQTLGVTCAEKFIFTPFINIFTYLNIPDCIGRESLFEAELNRCYDYYTSAINSNENEFVIGFIDELFTGTNHLEGVAGSYGLINKLSNIKTAITILSTHFHSICNFNNITYIKFDAHKSNDKYIFPYKASYGVSKQCIALELLHEKGFNKEIMDAAITKFNELKKNNKLNKIVN